MKKLILLVCLFFAVVGLQAYAGETLTIVVTVKENNGGGYNVNAQSRDDSGNLIANPTHYAAEKKDIPDAAASAVKEVVKTVGSKVRAGPDGEGDVVIGKIPRGDFPPIILTTGSEKPGLPKGSFIMNYKGIDALQSKYRRDLTRAIAKML